MSRYYDRLVHCHKVKKSIYILEEYDLIDGKITLIRSECPVCNETKKGIKCNGNNEHGFECGYANCKYDADSIDNLEEV